MRELSELPQWCSVVVFERGQDAYGPHVIDGPVSDLTRRTEYLRQGMDQASVDVNGIAGRVDGIDLRMGGVDSRLDTLDWRANNADSQYYTLGNRIDDVENSINSTWVAIQARIFDEGFLPPPGMGVSVGDVVCMASDPYSAPRVRKAVPFVVAEAGVLLGVVIKITSRWVNVGSGAMEYVTVAYVAISGIIGRLFTGLPYYEGSGFVTVDSNAKPVLYTGIGEPAYPLGRMDMSGMLQLNPR